MPAWYLPLHPAVKPAKALPSYNFSLASGLNASSSLFVSLSTVLLSVLQANGQTEMKRVVGDNATLPCHHQLWQADITLLDIEWMLHKSSSRQTVVSVCVCVCMRQCAADAGLRWSAVQCFLLRLWEGLSFCKLYHQLVLQSALWKLLSFNVTGLPRITPNNYFYDLMMWNWPEDKFYILIWPRLKLLPEVLPDTIYLTRKPFADWTSCQRRIISELFF